MWDLKMGGGIVVGDGAKWRGSMGGGTVPPFKGRQSTALLRLVGIH